MSLAEPSAATTAATSSIISLLLDEVRQSLEPKISHMLTDYQTYKETHDALLKIPFIKHLLENQCKCRPVVHEPIQLEIIDVDIAAEQVGNLPNLDSISEYINATIESDTEKEGSEEASEEEEEEASEEEEEEASEEEEEASEEEEEASEEEEETLVETLVEETLVETLVEETLVETLVEETLVETLVETEKTLVEETLVETLVEETLVEAEKTLVEETLVEDEEELELFEVMIKGKPYVTSDETDGDIYEYVNDEVGEIVGTFKNGVAKFAKKSKSAQKK